ncbi:TBC1 domain family member 20 isoform X1 [Neodiprion pinetum]|uniref:TBC1 domain family member 20 isoform X1 n=1 Tax=Neodiprion pinetum TaxID=441929 RepID=UPI001EE0598F|nr:TBC1 domain family member 20 isoform X1 [Neodiprion pinetum]
METDEDDLPLVQPVPGPLDNSVGELVRNAPSNLRKRNIGLGLSEASKRTEKGESTPESDARLNSFPSDATKIWGDGEISPRIPGIEVLESPGKSNGVKSPAPALDPSNTLPSDQSDNLESLTARERMKINIVRGCLSKPDLTFGELRLLGCSSEGFVNDDIRRMLWPRLLGLSDREPDPVNGLDTVHTKIPNEVYQQILKDVVRSTSHFPQESTEDETTALENEMTQMICWVLHRNKKLNYYQGYNDVAATVLMVMGLQRGLQVLEQISLRFLQRFMEATMEKVNQELFFIFALLERVHPTLLQHLENVELFPHFALAEYTTWYAHKYSEHRKLLHRLFDYFLGSPPLMPLYLSTVIVAHRSTEIFNTTPDMGHTHKVLCTLPEDLPFENLLVDAKDLYQKYPPDSIENDVRDYDNKRRRKEQEWKRVAEKNRQERERRSRLQVAVPHPRLPYRVGSYRTIAVVTVLALGIYAFLKSSSGLN